jgi:hypothetical protein
MRLVGLFGGIVLILPLIAHGGEIVNCEPPGLRANRVPQGHWSWRMIAGRECWYHGPRGKPKHELRWPKDQPQASEAERSGGEPDLAPATAPAIREKVREEVVQDKPGHGTAVGRTEDNAEPASSADEPTARAFRDMILLRGLSERSPPEIVPLPRPRPRPELPQEPPLWLFALLIIAPLVGAGLVLQLTRSDGYDDYERKRPSTVWR